MCTHAVPWHRGRYEIDLSDEHRDELLAALRASVVRARGWVQCHESFVTLLSPEVNRSCPDEHQGPDDANDPSGYRSPHSDALPALLI
ncbi:hypothetical protein [Cellulosimicrobium funkei]|uniref:hypothetical protein n=1 Tax=Cellulosimicrobium funkei TaxID=264251 RepID=UPI003C6D1FED